MPGAIDNLDALISKMSPNWKRDIGQIDREVDGESDTLYFACSPETEYSQAQIDATAMELLTRKAESLVFLAAVMRDILDQRLEIGDELWETLQRTVDNIDR